MARFQMELPVEIIKELNTLNKKSDGIFAQMTRAGAEVVKNLIEQNAPQGFKDSEIMRCLRITESYKTPSDGGINTKVAFYGYFVNKNGVRTPAPLVANVFEYGSSKIQKQPFLRKSFKKSEIIKAMMKAQKEASGGILEDE